MPKGIVFLEKINVLDDEKFTEELFNKWKTHLINSYVAIYKEFKSKLDPCSGVLFFASKSLIEEVIIDAVIGLKKIIDSKTHEVEFPNSFKIAAYLAYWWLRHKPVSLHYHPLEHSLEGIEILNDDRYSSEEEKEKERRKTVWELKHINELIAVQIVITYIFDLDNCVCGKQNCEKIKRSENNFQFDDFEEMLSVLLKKLTYYFSYRPITPKVIEHILEGYTFHPAWKLTGPHWSKE
jgi:hypothetical protein